MFTLKILHQGWQFLLITDNELKSGAKKSNNTARKGILVQQRAATFGDMPT